MSELIECVPNFSEARRPEVIQAIVEAITQEGQFQKYHRVLNRAR